MKENVIEAGDTPAIMFIPMTADISKQPDRILVVQNPAMYTLVRDMVREEYDTRLSAHNNKAMDNLIDAIKNPKPEHESLPPEEQMDFDIEEWMNNGSKEK